MRRVALLTLTLGLTPLVLAPPVSAKDPNRFVVHELVRLPHPMRVLKQDPARFGVTAEQMAQLQAQVVSVYPPKLYPCIQETWKLERAIRRAVIDDGAEPEAVAEQLDQLARLNREAADIRISALNAFRAILTPEQLKAVLEVEGDAD